MGVDYEFLSGRKNKAPDFVVNIKQDIYIIEHKHVKEGGGGQDKQIDELIEFVSKKPSKPHVHFVSYLDGYYFNILIRYKLAESSFRGNKLPKPLEQLKSIRTYLKDNKENYFINTAGFKELLNKS